LTRKLYRVVKIINSSNAPSSPFAKGEEQKGFKDRWNSRPSAALIGTAVAFGVGSLALTLLIKIIKIWKVFRFSYYCCAMGVLIIIFRSEEDSGGG